MRYFKRIKSKYQKEKHFHILWFFRTEDFNGTDTIKVEYFKENGDRGYPFQTYHMQWKEISEPEFAAYML